MNASDVMVCDVVTVGAEEAVSKAVQLLVDHDISALPVVDGERRVIGILSEADLLHREKIGTEKHRAWWLEAVTPPSVLALDYTKSHGRRVAELMSEDIISANEDTPLSELANILEKHRIKRVPILKDGKLVGIVSRSNLIQALASAPSIPRSRQYPKILWIDDAEVVGDGITKASPVLGDFVAQEIERDVRELSACGVAFVVRYIPVHE